jgi:carbonic anhydrase
VNPALRLLLSNKSWAQECLAIDPEFFARLAGGQRPEFLWYSCSDSRLPANEITATAPGELFVHRNIANIVGDSDINALSVAQYAIEALGVQHAVVCGHYGCGGVKAALYGQTPGLLAEWLQPIVALREDHREYLDDLPEAERWDRLVELNVVTQAARLSRTPIVQAAWKKTGRPYVHAWVYSIRDGLLHPIVTFTPSGAIKLPTSRDGEAVEAALALVVGAP